MSACPDLTLMTFPLMIVSLMVVSLMVVSLMTSPLVKLPNDPTYYNIMYLYIISEQASCITHLHVCKLLHQLQMKHVCVQVTRSQVVDYTSL